MQSVWIFFPTQYRRLFYEGFAGRKELKVEAVQTLKGLESEPQAVYFLLIRHSYFNCS